jgi:hypothetical protein
MTPPFSVRTSPHFDRLAEALTRRQPDFAARYDRAREILGHDPYNRTRQHHIKKLESIPAGAGTRVYAQISHPLREQVFRDLERHPKIVRIA